MADILDERVKECAGEISSAESNKTPLDLFHSISAVSLVFFLIHSQVISRIGLEREKNQRRVGRGGRTNLQLAVLRAALFPLPQKVNQPPGPFPSSLFLFLFSLLFISGLFPVALFCFWKSPISYLYWFSNASSTIVVLFERQEFSLLPAIKEALRPVGFSKRLEYFYIRDLQYCYFQEYKKSRKEKKKFFKRKKKSQDKLITINYRLGFFCLNNKYASTIVSGRSRVYYEKARA